MHRLILVMFLGLNAGTIQALSIEEGTVEIELDGIPLTVHYFRSPPADPLSPARTLFFLHGEPTGNAIWIPVMNHLSELANVDSYAISMIGFGRSEAPSPEQFDYRETSLNRVPFKVVEALGIDRFIGVAHDVGEVAGRHSPKILRLRIKNEEF